MRIYILILLTIFCYYSVISVVDGLLPKKSIIEIKEGHDLGGYWRNRQEWKAYWVKSWIPKTIYVPEWKKIWGPINIKEWIPLAHPPPPGWKPH